MDRNIEDRTDDKNHERSHGASQIESFTETSIKAKKFETAPSSDDEHQVNLLVTAAEPQEPIFIDA